MDTCYKQNFVACFKGLSFEKGYWNESKIVVSLVKVRSFLWSLFSCIRTKKNSLFGNFSSSGSFWTLHLVILFYMAEILVFNGVIFGARPTNVFRILWNPYKEIWSRKKTFTITSTIIWKFYYNSHKVPQKLKKNICYHLKVAVCIEIENFPSVEGLCDSSFKFYLVP